MTIALVSASLSLTFLPLFAPDGDADASIASSLNAEPVSPPTGTSADGAPEPDAPSPSLDCAPSAMANAFAEAPLLRASPTHSFTNRWSAEDKTHENVRNGRRTCKVTWLGESATNRTASSKLCLTASPPEEPSL